MKPGENRVRKRVAFVVQRCGIEVNGGAEAHCLAIAQRMSRYWETEVLTTCALDYVTWANHYPVGTEVINGTVVRRFEVAQERDNEAFNRLSSVLHPRSREAPLEEQENWMRAQGPWSPDLLDYIRTHTGDFDAFIFFGYLYAQTWFGFPYVAHKALLAPLAHDEWTIYLSMWDSLFTQPAGFIFNTLEERDFLRRRFPRVRLEGPIVGVAVDRPQDVNPIRFRNTYNIKDSFLLYVGRIDPCKGCEELFHHFLAHRRSGGKPEKLLLLGKAVMPVPKHPDIISLGFVSEQTKWDGLAACDVLVMPSPHESLSMVLLEAWAIGKPVLVNGHCEVLVGQCKRANGGVWYTSVKEFSSALTLLRAGETSDILGRQGLKFVQKNYTWSVVEKFYLQAIETLLNQ